MSEYKFTYFNLRGLGEHIRFMFIVAGVQFTDERVPATSDITKWKKMKPQVFKNIKYGQLPVLEVGGKELSQSLTISRFLAQKFNLLPEDPWLVAKADEIIDFASELRLEFRKFIIADDDEEKTRIKETLKSEHIPKYFGIMEQLAQEVVVGNFISGDKACWQDFYIANWIEIYGELIVGEDFINKYPKLKKIKEAVFAIPAIRDYLSKREKTFV